MFREIGDLNINIFKKHKNDLHFSKVEKSKMSYIIRK